MKKSTLRNYRNPFYYDYYYVVYYTTTTIYYNKFIWYYSESAPLMQFYSTHRQYINILFC